MRLLVCVISRHGMPVLAEELFELAGGVLFSITVFFQK